MSCITHPDEMVSLEWSNATHISARHSSDRLVFVAEEQPAVDRPYLHLKPLLPILPCPPLLRFLLLPCLPLTPYPLRLLDGGQADRK